MSSGPRRAAEAIAWARIGIGAAAVAKPPVPARPWVGTIADRPEARVLSRALGGRDLALGVGALRAARRGESVRLWVWAGVLADAVDVTATLLGFRALPRRGRWLVLAAAAGGAVGGALVAGSLDT